jgi:hypothetical protein
MMTKLGVVPLAAAPAILGKAAIPRVALLKKSLRFVEEFITLKGEYIPACEYWTDALGL